MTAGARPRGGRASGRLDALEGEFEPSELRARRDALGLSQVSLAVALGVSANTVARWERGQQTMANPRLVRLALERVELGAHTTPRRQIRAAEQRYRRPAQHNLPSAVTSFIGRRQDRRTLRQ